MVARDGPGRAVWLVRPNVRGRSRLLRWLADGEIAIGWYEVGPIGAGTDRETITRLVEATYPTRSPGSVRNAVGNIDRFVNRISIGDVVAVPDGPEVFLAEVISAPRYASGSEEAHRRHVRWLAPEAPLLRHELSGSAQAKLRTMLTVTDLSDVRDELLAVQEAFIGENVHADDAGLNGD